MVPYHRQEFYRCDIGRDRLIIVVKKHEFIGNYGDKVEIWWGSQWVLIYIFWLCNQRILWSGSCVGGSFNPVRCWYSEILSSCRKNFTIQSDNASNFASQELIPFVFSMNTKLDDGRKIVFRRWIFTEAQTGKTRLDTHYSFLNKNFNHMWRMKMIYSLKVILWGL